MSAASKYPESGEPKVSLGPVYAINPRYAKSMLIVEGGDTSWIDVKMMNGSLTSELEPIEWCKATAEAIKSANPEVEVWFARDLTMVGRDGWDG